MLSLSLSVNSMFITSAETVSHILLSSFQNLLLYLLLQGLSCQLPALIHSQQCLFSSKTILVEIWWPRPLLLPWIYYTHNCPPPPPAPARCNYIAYVQAHLYSFWVRPFPGLFRSLYRFLPISANVIYSKMCPSAFLSSSSLPLLLSLPFSSWIQKFLGSSGLSTLSAYPRNLT